MSATVSGTQSSVSRWTGARRALLSLSDTFTDCARENTRKNARKRGLGSTWSRLMAGRVWGRPGPRSSTAPWATRSHGTVTLLRSPARLLADAGQQHIPAGHSPAGHFLPARRARHLPARRMAAERNPAWVKF